MAETGKIRVNFATLKTHYPTYKTLPKPLQDFMDGLNKITPGNTPCCVQVSHALNKAGRLIPSRSYRRDNSPIDGFYYILAVDELEQYFSGLYGRGEEIKKGSVKTLAQMKAALDGRQGILLFRDTGAGYHTELWDQTHIVQDGTAVSGGGAVMNEANIFSKPRVLFWEVSEEPGGLNAIPDWLQGWWKVYDGNTYFYYFSDEHVVTYTNTAPKNIKMQPIKTPLNEGTVSISEDGVIVIDWNPADGGATQERFSRVAGPVETMNGTSNRYSPLSATKMY